MREGIENSKEKIVNQLRIGALKSLDSENPDIELENALTKSGMVAQSAIRARITSNIPPPLSESTLAARKRKGFKGTKALIETGQLRNSINFTIR